MSTLQAELVEEQQPMAVAVHEPPSQLDLAWAAGFIDGEGCFCIGRERDRRKPGHYQSYRACLSVSNTCFQSVKELMRIFATGSILNIPRFQPNHKPTYRWTVRNKLDLVKIILSLLPYFRTKRDAAEVCIAFCIQRIMANRKGRGRYAPYSDADIKLATRIREINKRWKWKPLPQK